MSASPEFYKPATAPPFSPPLLHATAGASPPEDYCCRTPTAGIAFLQEPDTCPPAPRKPRAAPPSACKKRLFDVVTLRLDDLERIFLPTTPNDKRRRSPDNNATSLRSAASSTHDELLSNPAASTSSSTASSASFNQVLSTSC